MYHLNGIWALIRIGPDFTLPIAAAAIALRFWNRFWMKGLWVNKVLISVSIDRTTHLWIAQPRNTWRKKWREDQIDEWKIDGTTKIVGSPKMLGAQKCWEYKVVGRTKMLGGQNCWEFKNVGSPKLLGGLNCWEYENVGSPKMLRVQKCWEYKILGRTKMLGGQNCWECKSVGSTKM